MKNRVLAAIFIIAICIITVCLTGCGNKENSNNLENNANEEIANEVDFSSSDSKKSSENENSIEGTFIVDFEGELKQVYGNCMILEFNNEKVTYKNTYLDQTKTGTYTVNDNIITINYTYTESFDEGADKDYKKEINESETYTINDKESIKQDSTGYIFYKE